MSQPALKPKIQHIDLPQVTETFADTVNTIVFDGQSLRLEFCVTRMQEPESADAAPQGKRYTACRVVLPPAAAAQLSGRLAQTLSAIVRQAGAKQAEQRAATEAAKQAAAEPAVQPSTH